MKIVKFGFSILIASIVMFSGCGKQKPEPKMTNIAKNGCNIKGEEAPLWVCLPEYKDSIAAVGIAKPNAGDDLSMQRAEAMADGRDALARQIQIKVSNMFKKFIATTGAGKAQTYEKTTENVSKQIASNTIQGSKPVDMWIHPKTNEMFLLVIAPTSQVTNAMKQTIKTTYKNDQALYQKFLAKQADGELDKELEKAGF